MKNIALLMFLIFAAHEVAACESPQPLSGIVKVPVCLAGGPDCRPASEVLHEYTEAQPDDPASFSIALQRAVGRNTLHHCAEQATNRCKLFSALSSLIKWTREKT